MLLQLAWRNVWRNRRRTVITISSIFFAVLLALFMRSLQFGSYKNMIRNSVELYSGYIQIHRNGYWEDRSINHLMEVTDSLSATVASTPHVEFAIPRLETFVLAAAEEVSKGVVVIGTDPVLEDRMTRLADRVVEGAYMEADTRGVMVAEGLAEYLDIGVHDTLIMIGQGYRGANAVDMYPVTAILRFANPQQNENTVYAPIRLLQQFTSAPAMASALVISIDDLKHLKSVKRELRAAAGEEYEVMDWEELQPELVQAIASDNASGMILLGILYVVIAFGVFGTVMMMTIERQREFAVMVAVGMQKRWLSALVAVETLIIGAIGLAVSFVAGVILLVYMYHNPIPMTGDAGRAMVEMGLEPILPFSLDPAIFTSQMFAVVVIVTICLWYPFWSIVRLQPVTSLRR